MKFPYGNLSALLARHVAVMDSFFGHQEISGSHICIYDEKEYTKMFFQDGISMICVHNTLHRAFYPGH